MTAQAIVRALRSRGVTLEARGDRLRIVPAGLVPPHEMQMLRECKAAVIAQLRAEAADDSWADGTPNEPCGLCGGSVYFVEDWPTPGERRWLCLGCARQPAPSMAAVLAGLTVDERAQLEAEAQHGDELARLVLSEAKMGAS